MYLCSSVPVGVGDCGPEKKKSKGSQLATLATPMLIPLSLHGRDGL